MLGCKHEFVRDFCDASCRCLLCGHTESFKSAAEAWNAGMGIATAAIAERDELLGRCIKMVESLHRAQTNCTLTDCTATQLIADIRKIRGGK